MFASLLEVLQRHLENLETDQSVVWEMQSRLASQLPPLRSRADELRLELAKEKARQAELDAADQEHLQELRQGIAEQHAQLEDYKRENQEVVGQLERLDGKAAEMDLRAAEAKEAITQSKRVCDEVRFYTKSELYRLQGKPVL